MMKNFWSRRIICVAVAGACMAVLNGCGSSATTAAPGLVASIKTMNTRLAQYAPHVNYTTDGTSGGTTRQALDMTRGAFGSLWTTNGLLGNLYNGGNLGTQPPSLSPKAYMGEALDPAFINSNGAYVQVFGRFNTATGFLCAMGLLLPLDSDGTPTAGSYSKTISPTSPANLTSLCGLTVDASATVTVTVTATTNTTYYTKKVQLTPPSGGGNAHPQTMLLGLKADGSQYVASFEDGTLDDRATQLLYAYNAATKQLKFQFLEVNYNGQDGGEFYRIFGDTNANVSYLLGFNGGSTNPIVYTASGFPRSASGVATGTLALSMTWSGQTGSAQTDLEACVGYDGTISTDNSLACSVAGSHSSVGLATKAATFTAHQSGQATGEATLAVTETSVPPFTTGAEMNTTTGR